MRIIIIVKYCKILYLFIFYNYVYHAIYEIKNLTKIISLMYRIRFF